MADCTPFLKVPDIAKTIEWYVDIGFTCTATNEQWEPGCELNWAMIKWENAAFMIGIATGKINGEEKDASLWFDTDSIDNIISTLESKNIPVNIEPETFYGRNVVSFRDVNGFDVSFSCALSK